MYPEVRAVGTEFLGRLDDRLTDDGVLEPPTQGPAADGDLVHHVCVVLAVSLDGRDDSGL